MVGPKIATVRGRLQLVVGDAEPIGLGGIEIEVTAETSLSGKGDLVLAAKPNMREVRELVEVAFGEPRYQHNITQEDEA